MSIRADEDHRNRCWIYGKRAKRAKEVKCQIIWRVRGVPGEIEPVVIGCHKTCVPCRVEVKGDNDDLSLLYFR